MSETIPHKPFSSELEDCYVEIERLRRKLAEAYIDISLQTGEIERLRRLLVELAVLAEPYAEPQGPDNQIDLALSLAIAIAKDQRAEEGKP